MTEDEWLKKVNYRRTPGVCISCKYYENCYEGEGYCIHPTTEDELIHIVVEGTCNLFEEVKSK